MKYPHLDDSAEPALRVWRAVGTHDTLQPALEAALGAVRPELEARFALIRLLIPEHRLWETVATVDDGSVNVQSGGDHVPEGRHAGLPAALRRAGTLRVDAAEFARGEPAMLPPSLYGPVVVIVLADEPTVTGVLVVGVAGERSPAGRSRTAIDAMIEPLASALRHHVRLHDATALREAAEAERRALLTRLGRTGVPEAIVGAEAGLREVMDRVAQVARSDTPVLVLGETGSGKEVVARAVHRGSDRATGPFVRVNCGAIPADLIDSELFGHERGSFTGAVAQRKGWFERADTGTLFLDEVGELPLPAQVRLLRVLQDGLVTRVGGEKAIAVDVRVIAATNQDLRSMMRQGSFREDLWYRLAVFPIHLPSLRERLGDLPALAMHFAQRAAARLGLAPCMPGERDLRLLAGYDWPGNVRELSSVIERAAILGNGKRLEVAAALGVGVPPRIASPLVAGPVDKPGVPDGPEPRATERQAFRTLDQHARDHIEAALRNCLGRVDGPFGAALALGVNPQTLRSRMKKLGIVAAVFRRDGRA